MSAPFFSGLQTATLNGGLKTGGVNLTWNAVSPIDFPPIGYRVYVRQGSAPDFFGPSSIYFAFETMGLSVDVYSQVNGTSRLEGDTEYFFIVRAVNQAGDEDTNTYALSVTTPVVGPVFTDTDTNDVFPFITHYSFNETIRQRTLLSTFESGKEQRRGVWSAPLRSFTVTLSPLEKIDAQTLWQFFEDHVHATKTFLFHNINDAKVTEIVDPVGQTVSYGVTLSDPPLKAGSLRVFAGGETIRDTGLGALTSTLLIAGTIDYIAGDLSLEFITPPTTVITAEYDHLRRVRFDLEPLSSENFSFRLYNFGLNLIEVRL